MFNAFGGSGSRRNWRNPAPLGTRPHDLNLGKSVYILNLLLFYSHMSQEKLHPNLQSYVHLLRSISLAVLICPSGIYRLHWIYLRKFVKQNYMSAYFWEDLIYLWMRMNRLELLFLVCLQGFSNNKNVLWNLFCH